MPKENYYQAQLCKIAKSNGGYGAKWSSSFKVGPPDLIMSYPKTGIFLMEVKKIDVTIPNFKRKIDATELQRKYLNSYVDAGGVAFIGVVVVWGMGAWDLVACPPYAKELHGSTYKDVYPHRGYTKKYIDTSGLVEEYIRNNI